MATQAAKTPAKARVRLTARLAAGAAVAGAVTLPFLGLLLLVEGKNERLESLDLGIAGELNSWALGHPSVVRLLLVLQDVLNPNTFRALALVAAIALWRSGARQLALWAVVTTAAGALLGVVLKQLVHRARPTFTDPVAVAGSFSFPSGHALGSFLGAGVLLAIVLPVLSRRARALAWSVAVGVVLLTGFDRIALGVHFVSDVLAGWIAAGAVLAGTATAFGTWRGTRRRPGGLDPAGSRRLARTVSQPDR
jgi:undecaprenyl-diphosphatase